MFFSLVDLVGVLLEHRLRRGRFSVRWSRRAARFLKTSSAKMFSGLVVESSGVLFEKHRDEDIFQFGGREERRAFRKNVLKMTFLVEGSGALFDEKRREERCVFLENVFFTRRTSFSSVIERIGAVF